MNRLLVVLASLLLLASSLVGVDASAKNRSGNKARIRTLYDYASTIHWSEFDKAIDFVDPQWLAKHPVTHLDMERYKQVHVSGYEVRTSVLQTDGSGYDQVVLIRLININTQVEREITDRQHWRWDPEAKRWWLTTGLPNITPGDDDEDE